MISNLSRAAALIAAFALAAPAAAQDTSANRVAADTDWSVFVEDDPQECWGVSAPKQEEFFRDGSPVSASTGEALLFVFYRPGAGVRGQVTYTGGYPFAGGSTVTLDIGGSEYELFTEGEWAWPATPQDDARLVAAMRRGAEAEVRGRSGRGNVTIDEFSLLGFTAALDEAQNRCAG